MTSAVSEKKTEGTNVKYAHVLDAQAYSGNDLGATYTKDATIFKVWAPSAQRVAVKLYSTGSSEEEGAQNLSITSMSKGEDGIWSARLDGDKKNLYYTYVVTVDGVSRETADIYAKAAGVNGNRSMIVDLDSTDPKDWDKDKHVLYDDPTDAVVWEVHIKDFSSSEVSGVSLKHKGKYLAFTEGGTTIDGKGDYPTCINYLKKLGVTHVQLLPVYDYATVDESDTQTDQFNWGYDPKNYNVPEGSYSTDPFHGDVRIKEFKQMIKALHDADIGVIMDVVYNHTFTGEGSWFEMTVPGYYFRMKDDGSFSDGSACGNETASDHLMYRKYMIDSVLYWVNEYHIDGFRFDLMGVHDITTMNEIRKALDSRVENGKKIIMYGEPWTGGELATKEPTAVKSNISKLDSRIGAFNDDFRDAVKGHVFNGIEKGFVQSAKGKTNIEAAIAANTLVNNWASQPSQAVTYTSAHDNFTLYDKLVISVKNDGSFEKRDEELVEMNKLSAALTLTSQGISFMQAGEEFARTKLGDENSYISSTKINQLDWNRSVEFADLVSYYSGLIEIRKNFKPFRDATMTSAKLINYCDTDSGVVAYTLENTLTSGKEWQQVAVIFNANDEQKEVTLTPPKGKKLPEEWIIVANKYEAGLEPLGSVKGNKVTLPPRSAMVLADSTSFKKLALSSSRCTVRAEYRDSETGELLSSKVYKGDEGSSYATSKDTTLDVQYDFEKTEGNTSGKFTKAPQAVTYYYKKFSGKIVTLKVNYMKPGDEKLSGEDEEVSPSTTQLIREGSQYAATLKTINGMEADVSRFPSNAAGTAGKDDITVTYYYKAAGDSDLTLHYYNSSAWKKVCAYVYYQHDGEKKSFTSESGDEMKADEKLGEGWYTLKVPKAGSRENVYAVFGNGGKDKDTRFGQDGCPVHGEVWVDDKSVKYLGKVYVIHLGTKGEVLKTEELTGKEGEPYTAKESSFENMHLSAYSDNRTGVFTETPVYVLCRYSEGAENKEQSDKTEEAVKANNEMKTIGIVLGISAILMAGAAAALTVISKKRK